METASRNTIMLEIEGKIIICNRMVLTNHSDYFRAMLEGNFVERNKDIICLNEIEFVAMETILKQLQNRNHIIEEENILSVLQAACMLQFLGIKATCVKRLQEILSVKNCLQIWICTEYLSCEEGVCLKAKHLALKEFMFLKDTYDFLALTLEQIVNYLGSPNLRCLDELIIYEAMMRWHRNVGGENIFPRLLHCLDFGRLSQADIHKIILEPNIGGNQQTLDILHCIIAIKNKYNLSNYKEGTKREAYTLLTSKKRDVQQSRHQFWRKTTEKYSPRRSTCNTEGSICNTDCTFIFSYEE